MCDRWLTKGWSSDYLPSESHFLCVMTKNNFSLNFDKNIEIHFISYVQKDKREKYIESFRKLTEENRIKSINIDVKKIIANLGLQLEYSNFYNLGYIDESIKKFHRQKDFRHFGVNRTQPFYIIEKPKEKIIVYFDFLYGQGINYSSKYGLDRKITIVKLN